ncbi:hypothetical protein IFM89_025350 [Coptis chinensis]|uniref:Uncharacterized protein n=1 Tax=Coptis chinensis TaxID=261450 RepID=A0A835HGS1_9MAGN|nr:hypothetical protein IFM89_025350 [Coptis chinensis]
MLSGIFFVRQIISPLNHFPNRIKSRTLSIPTSRAKSSRKSNFQCFIIWVRSPVELSCAVETLLPFHTTIATASALLTSMLTVSRPGLGWLPEAT